LWASATCATLLLCAGGIRVVQGQQTPSPADKGRIPVAPVTPPAAAEKPGARAPKPAQAEPEYVNLHMINWHHDEQTQLDVCDEFVYEEKDTTITGDHGRYNGKEKILDATGSLTLDDPKHHLTADKAHIERKQKLAVFIGHVVMTLKPETPGAGGPPPAKPGAAPDPSVRHAAADAQPSPRTASDEPTETERSQSRKRGATATCDHVDDWYSAKRKFSVLKGHVIFTQVVNRKDGTKVTRTLLCEHAEYDGVKDSLKLFAPVNGYDTDNEDLHFKEDVLIGTKEGYETLTSRGASEFKIKLEKEDEDEETGESKQAAPAPSGKKTPGNPTPGNPPPGK